MRKDGQKTVEHCLSKCGELRASECGRKEVSNKNGNGKERIKMDKNAKIML